jgi:hypothetical protein
MKTLKQLLEESKEKWLGTSNPHDKRYYYDVRKQQFGNPFPELDNEASSLHPQKNILSDDEQKHVGKYQVGYTPNHALRTDNTEAIKNYHQPQIDHLDSAMHKHALQNNIHAWRGISSNKSASEVLDNLKPGDTFHDKGYTSTSLNPHISKDFGSQNKNLIHIKVPKGSHGLYLNHILGNSVLPEQHELVLPRNSKFRYEGKEENNGWTIHHVTHLGSDSPKPLPKWTDEDEKVYQELHK